MVKPPELSEPTCAPLSTITKTGPVRVALVMWNYLGQRASFMRLIESCGSLHIIRVCNELEQCAACSATADAANARSMATKGGMQVVPSQSTILVTGAGGFVGSHVVLELLSQDYNVIAVDNYTNCVKGGSRLTSGCVLGEVTLSENDVK
ncbi:hypothetical protein M514_05236 [Trichuris suis]|uniref:NAD-dependent epimerase/dehydratase domain-containing protein n=1 Tax=Trichuris suis TaxID=68888 RepID=A0A085M9S3_9BILA|nr:hypothetical protein M513_05236 [Trichuris suis]KFD67356.1 hypothetical protein M514_05236 [Trichuris suis]